MSALIATHGPRWAGRGSELGLHLALGPDVADIVRLQVAAMLAMLPRPRLI